MKVAHLALLIAALPLAAQAQAQPQAQPQAWTPRPGAPAMDYGRYQADQHRLAMQQLRLQADRREAFARQLETETRLRRLELEAARQAEPYAPPPPRALASPEAERAAREAATRRREGVQAGTQQIDDWLDRRPN